MKSTVSALLVVMMASAVCAANWPQWRGPNHNGSTDEKGLPTKWSTTENIAWSVDLPGPGAATPIVWNDHVFISSTDAKKGTLKAMCFDRKNGDLRWSHDVGKGVKQDSRSHFASPSPVTDGKLVVFFFGNGDLAAYDFMGKEQWSRNVQKDFGEFAFLWTFSTSPVLYDGKLFLQVLQRDTAVTYQGDVRGFEDRKNESYLLALEPSTGDLLWRHVRPSKARVESLEAFTTPIPYEGNGRKELIIAGGDDLTGHDPATGKELWRWGTWNPNRITHWRLVPSPVAGGGVLLVCAPKSDPIYAVKAGGEGQLDNSALAWDTRDKRDVTSDVPTPAYYDGDFFVLSDLKFTLSRLNPKTGEVKWSIRLPRGSKFEASPLAADGKIYVTNFAGKVVVVDAGSGQLIHEVEMESEGGYNNRSSVAAAQGQLFIRTPSKLYCVGN